MRKPKMVYSMPMLRWVRILAILFLVVLSLSIGVLYYGFTLTKPVSSTAQPTQTFVVPPGQAVSVIADRLAAANLIRHPLVFRLEIKRLGLEKKLQAGSFAISPAMTPAQVAQALTVGTSDIWVTILEGWRREEIAEAMSRQEFPAFDADEFLELTASSEGMLFPDTYLLPRQVTAEGVYDMLTTTFDQKVVKGLASDIEASDRSFEDVLVMASLIEREARDYEQMRMVSGILWNRIDDGIALNVDATLQYIKGYNQAQKSWWSPPLAADKQIESAYNTYTNASLPPQPIANPGLDAIKAALRPTKSEYYFYIHDQQGTMHYARTLSDHNRNVERYLR
jgi:UPF0755 protein